MTKGSALARMHRPRLQNYIMVSALLLATGMGGMGLSGCRVNESDVERWGTTAHGPDKLVAVLTHSKYEPSLRIAAGLELVKMKPRNGRRVGITMLVDALSTLAPEERKPLIAGMAPTLVAEMKKVPPAAAANQPPPVDTSYPYKDAVVALLTYDRAVL